MTEYRFPENAVQSLITWYSTHKRSLPWRDTGDPYDVWLSEIMLQQTRVEAVIPRFLMFKKELPTIQDLSLCDDDRLMRLWEGLGYYSRARNLKKCALILTEKYEGKLPPDPDLLIKLPGIGPYTAGAIASIAFGIGVPAADGNIMRILARYFGIREDIRLPETKKMFEEILKEVFTHPSFSAAGSEINQGFMELGQTVCIPNGSPLCASCPLSGSCHAYRTDTVPDYPFRSALKKRKIVQRTLLIIRDGQYFLMRKRPDSGLLAGLYEFTGIEHPCTKSEAVSEAEHMGLKPLTIRTLPDSVHIFTHLEWHMKAFEIQVEELTQMPAEPFLRVTKKELSDMAIPSAFKTYVDWYSLRD